MYYLCEKYYKPITVQYYIADCVSWVPRLTLLDLRKNWTYECALRTELIHIQGTYYILKINLLSVTSFANIFFQSVGCLFILFMVSFAVKKLLNLIRPHLFIFAFIFITLGDGPKKILLRFMSQSVLPMFSSKSLIVSCLTFRSLILCLLFHLQIFSSSPQVVF